MIECLLGYKTVLFHRAAHSVSKSHTGYTKNALVQNSDILPVAFLHRVYEPIEYDDFVAQQVLYHLRCPRLRTVKVIQRYCQDTEHIDFEGLK